MAVLDAGWPDTVPGVVLDRRCCSGLESIFYGSLQIQTGNAEIIVAGGMDSMSQAELYIRVILNGVSAVRTMTSMVSCQGPRRPCDVGIPLYDRIQRGRVMFNPSTVTEN